MNLFKINPLRRMVFIVPLLVYGCTYTSSFPPKLNGKGAAIMDKIKSTNGFEDIDMLEKKTNGSNGNSTTLTVKLYNGKNIPADTAAEKKLGSEIATQIKPGLMEASAINSYIILFCTRTVSGNTTQTNYNGYEYKAAEVH